jgi:hypothetical protein
MALVPSCHSPDADRAIRTEHKTMTATQPTLNQTSAEAERRQGPVERIIETLASGMGNGIGFMAETGILFVVFAAMWVAFGFGLVQSQGGLDSAWQWIRGMPLLVQGLAWLLFLPVMVGLWIWETTWPLVLRLVLVAGLAGWNLLILLPRFAGR